MKLLMLVSALSLLWLSPCAAHATDDSVTVGYQPAWFLLGGATAGASFGSTENGGYVGAELSAARMYRGWWYGLFGDAMYDFGSGTPSASLGPEFGYWFLGVDGGLGIRGYDSAVEFGPQIRGLLTFGLFSLYYRQTYWPRATNNRNVQQVGMLLKIPLVGGRGSGAWPPDNLGRRRQ